MASVLIVDDERVLTDAYDIVLTKAGYKVLVANHPKDGVTLAVEQKPDVILLDMLMPEMNGIEFLQQIKKLKVTKPKVIAFSNIENPELMEAAKKLGVLDYLLKVNYTPHQVADLIKAVLHGKTPPVSTEKA